MIRYCQNYSPLPLRERVRVRGEKSTRIVSKTPSMLMNTSVSVEPFLNALATSLSSFTPTLFPPPSRGRDVLVFLYLPDWFFITFLTLPMILDSLSYPYALGPKGADPI